MFYGKKYTVDFVLDKFNMTVTIQYQIYLSVVLLKIYNIIINRDLLNQLDIDSCFNNQIIKRSCMNGEIFIQYIHCGANTLFLYKNQKF